MLDNKSARHDFPKSVKHVTLIRGNDGTVINILRSFIKLLT